jgi:hypothetical protein
MHEPLLERIRQLERSVLRWQLVCLALVIVVVALLAIGGTFGAIILLELPNRHEIEMVRDEADAARQQADAARQDAVQAMEQERAARHEAERALQAERAARQQKEGK